MVKQIQTDGLSAEQLEQKIYTLLGFAQKAGKVVSGDDSVFVTLKQKKIPLLVVAKDISENSKQKFEQKLYAAHNNKKDLPPTQQQGAANGTDNKKRKTNKQTPTVIEFGEKAGLGLAIGKSPRGLVAVMDQSFSQAIITYHQAFVCNKGVV